MTDLIKKISAIFSLVAIVFGAFFFLDGRHASVQTVTALEERVTLQELRRLLMNAEEDMYHYRRLARKYPDDKDIAKKLKEAEERVEDLKERIKKREAETES